MTAIETALIVVASLFVLESICFAIYVAKNKKNNSQSDKVEVIDGVRYSKDAQMLDESGAVMVSLKQGDFVLERGKTYTAGKGGLLPGKYTVISGQENCKTFNLRVAGLVKEYSHGQKIVLAQGDKICAVSNNVILR